MADVTVRESPERSRFVAHVGDEAEEVGFAAYARDGDTVVLTHTVVSPEHEGQGVGSALARGVLDALRERGATVRVQCPFMAAYVRRHPEYAELLEAPAR